MVIYSWNFSFRKLPILCFRTAGTLEIGNSERNRAQRALISQPYPLSAYALIRACMVLITNAI